MVNIDSTLFNFDSNKVLFIDSATYEDLLCSHYDALQLYDDLKKIVFLSEEVKKIPYSHGLYLKLLNHQLYRLILQDEYLDKIELKDTDSPEVSRAIYLLKDKITQKEEPSYLVKDKKYYEYLRVGENGLLVILYPEFFTYLFENKENYFQFLQMLLKHSYEFGSRISKMKLDYSLLLSYFHSKITPSFYELLKLKLIY